MKRTKCFNTGLVPDIENLIGQTDANRQLVTLLCYNSGQDYATLQKRICLNRLSVTAEGKHVTLDSIDQRVYMMQSEKDKRLASSE